MKNILSNSVLATLSPLPSLGHTGQPNSNCEFFFLLVPLHGMLSFTHLSVNLLEGQLSQKCLNFKP